MEKEAEAEAAEAEAAVALACGEHWHRDRQHGHYRAVLGDEARRVAASREDHDEGRVDLRTSTQV